MSPVSSVESWFFSSFGWNVPMPTRSCADKSSRRTWTWFKTRVQSPPYRVISSRNSWRQNGQRSPSMAIGYVPAAASALRSWRTTGRSSFGTKWSGSSCIGQATTSSRLSRSLIQPNVYKAPPWVRE